MRFGVMSRLVAAGCVLFMVSISFASPVKFTSAWTDTVPSFEFGAYLLGDTMKIQSDGAHGGVYAWDAFTLQDPAGNLKINHHIVAPELFTYTLLPTDLQGIWTACQKWWEYDDSGNKVWAYTVGTTTVTSPSGNMAPYATIDSISPSPAGQYATVNFLGHGSDTDGVIAGWSWRSSINGQLSATASFSTSSLSVGTHTIYFKVMDNLGAFSIEVSQQLVVRAAPVAKIVSITPTTAIPGALVSFTGSGTDPNNAPITAYNWRSSVDGSLPGYASFQWGGLSPGIHTIYFKVMNNLGIWSPEVTSTVTIDDNDGAPLAQDLDSYVNLKVTVALWEVNEIEKVDGDTGIWPFLTHDPADFYWKITVGSLPTINPSNSGPFISNQDHIGGPGATTLLGEYTFDVSDSMSSPTVQVKIELWDDDDGAGKTKADDQCDISRQASYVNSQKNMAGRAAILTYDLRTGDWTGDDGFAGDPNGIGHVSGIEDGSSASVDQDDCELWFWIWQNDYDHDGLTYQEEISRGTSPVLTEDADYDGDGLWTDAEWASHSKVDVKDSDGDGIQDGFEWRCTSLNPICGSDAAGYCDAIRANLDFAVPALAKWSQEMSYSYLCSLYAAADIGLGDLKDKYIYQRTAELDWLTNAGYALGVIGLPLGDPFLGADYLFKLLEYEFTGWMQLNINWNSYTSTTAPQTYAGVVHQVNAGNGFDTSQPLATKLMQLSGQLSSMRQWCYPGTFGTFLLFASNAKSTFGTITMATSNLAIHTRDANHADTNMNVVFTSDSNRDDYSEVEKLVYDFANRLNVWYAGSLTDLTPGAPGDYTVGDVAHDLMNLAYDLYGLMFAERVWLTGLTL